MYSSAGPRSALDTVKEFERVRSFFAQALKELPADPVPVRLVAFGNAKEYEPYRPNEFATAYYQPTDFRDYIVMSHAGADTFPLAVHEYVHLLIRHSDLDLPPWLNEGLAELYSTLRPLGDKILVGDLILARHRALLSDKWVPLHVILSAGRDSPYYNEKDKAGSLYNEGWALTHMLYFAAAYRADFGRLLRAISGGKDSAAALAEVYGRPLPQIERDLQAYLRGATFQGALVPARFEKASQEIPVETPADFDTSLMLADLLSQPGREAAQQAAFDALTRQDPNRPEPYRGLGYIAWRTRKSELALRQFDKAYEHGLREGKFLWDYGRLLESNRGENAAVVLSELLKQDSARVDVRLELAETQLRADRAAETLQTLQPMHSLTSKDAPRYFRIAVYAYLRNRDLKNAEHAARHFREIAKTEDDRAAADLLIRQIPVPAPRPQTEAAEVDSARPMLRRSTGTETAPPEMPHPVQRATVSGRLAELTCLGNQARMSVETEAGRKTFLIEDPDRVVITAGRTGPAEMTCGPQKSDVHIEIGYDAPRTGQSGIDGVVRSLTFRD